MNRVKFLSQADISCVDLLVIPCMGQKTSPLFKQIDDALVGGASAAAQQFKFTGHFRDFCAFTTNGRYSIPRVLLVGVGSGAQVEMQQLSALILDALGDAQRIAIDGFDQAALPLMFELCTQAWQMPSYKSSGRRELSWAHISDDPESNASLFRESQWLLDSIAYARTLIAAPANRLNPAQFANRCLELRHLGLEVECLDKEALEKEGFHALLAVGQGSVNAPYVVVLRWKGSEEAPVAFVGKGVCFDAGGINIKMRHLPEMKWDKAGAGAVVGLMHMLASSRAPVHAVGIIGLVENMVDGASLKPGDIIETHAGLTVEVADTDNEGRLVLCDCISYIQKTERPRLLIDLGTLTPETFAVLADEYAGLFSDDDLLSRQLMRSGEISGEKVWPLPMGTVFAKQIESKEADIKNSGVIGFGESGAAAEFLRRFIEPGIRWAHLDIAGVSWTSEGVTGYGIRLLYTFLFPAFSLKDNREF